MVRIVVLFLLAVNSQALPTSRPSVTTTCGDFGRDLTIDHDKAVGVWHTVYMWPAATQHFNETLVITKLTPDDEITYKEVLEASSTSNPKLYVNTSTHFELEDKQNSIILDVDKTGTGSGLFEGQMFEFLKSNGIGPDFSIKFKQLGDFLVLMFCDISKVYIISKDVPDVKDLERAAASLHVEGLNGGMVHGVSQ